MPTPVTTARQYLTEEAARALDDAVSIAKRRKHSQTTSLHAISALLSPSFSLLRDSISRGGSSGAGYSPRLHLRALELCVGVSLDRLPSSPSSSQNDDAAPPISNSLTAAIKRAQANQRRQPDIYHLNQIHLSNNPISISAIKVELKHFVLSIFDDPIVSRVFGDAGFRSSDIKLAIIHPPMTSPSRWGHTRRPPPLFLCNMMEFPGFAGDENCRRIGEVMLKKKEKNPVLVGVCAKDALTSFKGCLEKGKLSELPREIHGVKMVCLESEIGMFVRGEKEGFDMKLKEVSLMVENCNSGPGVVVSLGELKVLVKEEGGDEDDDVVNQLVFKLSGLVEVYGKKLWMIGAAANYETYSKFMGRFPSIEKDWDLHPLPITSSKSSFDALGSKSSLLGSFVPLGGFFPTQPEFRSPLAIAKQPFTRCNSCNKMYEKELCAMLREGSSVSIANKCSESLPIWLQRSDFSLAKGGDMLAQVKDVKAASSEQILELQRKWNDHCRHLHQIQSYSSPVAPLVRQQAPHNLAFQFVSGIGDSSLDKGVCSTASTSLHVACSTTTTSTVDYPQKPVEISECQPSIRESSVSIPYPIHDLSLPLDYQPGSTLAVTTDLGLGTIYASKGEKLKKPLFHTGPVLKEGLNLADYKLLVKKLSTVVPWQGEAMSKISEIVSSCRSGNGRQYSSNVRGNIWLSFHGPDKIGKRRVAEALADGVFGSRDRLIFVDLSSQDNSSKAYSLFRCQGTLDIDVNMSRITVVDLIARELCKKPHSVVFLENIDEADPLVQNSLSRAIQTGKFPDSSGRETSVKSVIFIVTSSAANEGKVLSPRKEYIKFSEEKVLEAKNWQIQVTIRNKTQGTSKRKAPNIGVSSEVMDFGKRVRKNPKQCLDLNLPLEEAVEIDCQDTDALSDSSSAWLEEFCSQADGNVLFKPLDFDTLAEKFLTKMRVKFEETFKVEKTWLEIDNEVMVQILAAAWCAENQGAVEKWIENVVGVTFAEARERVRITDDEYVVRLASCQGFTVNEWAAGICLPINLNLSV